MAGLIGTAFPQIYGLSILAFPETFYKTPLEGLSKRRKVEEKWSPGPTFVHKKPDIFKPGATCKNNYWNMQEFCIIYTHITKRTTDIML